MNIYVNDPPAFISGNAENWRPNPFNLWKRPGAEQIVVVILWEIRTTGNDQIVILRVITKSSKTEVKSKALSIAE
jgi:hypothetical protein